jgi:hypothetical protein
MHTRSHGHLDLDNSLHTSANTVAFTNTRKPEYEHEPKPQAAKPTPLREGPFLNTLTSKMRASCRVTVIPLAFLPTPCPLPLPASACRCIASATTCAFVRMVPLPSTRKPLPLLPTGKGPALWTLMLTTAGAAHAAASLMKYGLRQPAGVVLGGGSGG